MLYDYYPGCTITGAGSGYDIQLLKIAGALGVELKELENWQCCGGVYPICSNETAQKLPGVRALSDSFAGEARLVTGCSACYHVLKSVNFDMRTNEAIRKKAASYLGADEPYSGQTRVLHFIELLRDDIGFEEIKKRVKKPLGRKIGAFYGCLLLRPSAIIGFDDAENPSALENLIDALGGEGIFYPFSNECCGAYAGAEDSSLVEKSCKKIAQSALSHSAEQIVTACPLCLYNLKKYTSVPVCFFTELLCEALGV